MLHHTNASVNFWQSLHTPKLTVAFLPLILSVYNDNNTIINGDGGYGLLAAYIVAALRRSVVVSALA